MRDYSELFTHGVQAQKEKLDENSHKSGFDSATIDYAFKRIRQEFYELEQEYVMRDQNIKAIRAEFADVCNFGHMGILACDKKLEL